MIGVLPWQNLKTKPNEDRYKRIYEIKNTVKPKDLCNGLHRN